MPLVKSRTLGDVSEMGGRFARQKQQEELVAEKQKAAQVQQLLQIQAAATGLANKKSNGKRSFPSVEGGSSSVTIPGVKRPLIIPAHMNGATELLKQKQEQAKQIKTAIADAEKTQKETVKTMTPQQLLLAQLQAMRGSGGGGETGVNNEHEGNQVEVDDDDDDDDDDENEGFNGDFMSLMLAQQTAMLKELQEHQQQNARTMELMTSLFLPKPASLEKPRKTEEEKMLNNRFNARQTHYLNVLEKMHAEQQKEEYNQNLANLLQTLSRNPDLERYMAPHSSVSENQSSSKSKKAISAAKKKKKSQLEDSTNEEEEETTDLPSNNKPSIDEAIRQLLYSSD